MSARGAKPSLGMRWFTSRMLAGLLCVVAPDVFGCSPVQGTRFATIEQMTGSASFVVQAVPAEYIGKGVFRVQVVKWLKGTGPNEILVGGLAEREGVFTSCDKDLSIGEEALLFLTSDGVNSHTIRFVHTRGLWFEPVQAPTPASIGAVRRSLK